MNNEYLLNDLMNYLLFYGNKLSILFKKYKYRKKLTLTKEQEENAKNNGYYLEFKYEDDDENIYIQHYVDLLSLFKEEIKLLPINFENDNKPINNLLKKQIIEFEKLIKKKGFSFRIINIKNIFIFDKNETNIKNISNEMYMFSDNDEKITLNIEELKNNSTKFYKILNNEDIRLYFKGKIMIKFNNSKFNVQNFNYFYESYIINNK